MKKIRLFELTEFPHIFKDCYWGRFDIPENTENEAVKNRNVFVEEYKITKYISNESPKSGLGIFDHCELYRCEAGLVYVVSHHDTTESHDSCAEQNGFKKYRNLYLDNSSTYIQTFSDKYEFNRYKKTH